MMWFYFALLSAFLIGLAYVVQKKSLLKERTTDFIAINLFFLFIISLFLIPKVNFNIPFKSFVLIYIISFISGVAFIYLTKSIRHMEVSSAIPLISFIPAIVAILSVFVLKESLKTNHFVGIALIVAGAYALESTTKKFDLIRPFRMIFKSKYIHYIFISLILYSVVRILERFILYTSSSLKVDSFTLLFFAIMFFSFTYVIILMISKHRFYDIKKSFKRSYILILMVTLLFFAGRFARYVSISFPVENTGMVVAVTQLSILVSTIIGGELFHEHARVKKIITTLIMLIGIFFIVT